MQSIDRMPVPVPVTPPENGNSQKFLKFPLDISQEKDEAGKMQSYMLIEIASSASGSMMEGDVVVPPPAANVVDETGRLSFGNDLGNKPYNMKNGLVQVNTSIVLPMPANYNVSTAVEYSSDFEPASALKFTDFAMGNSSVGSKAAEYAAQRLMGTRDSPGVINKLINSTFGGDGGLSSQQLQASQRIMENPRKEVLFTGFDFRNFDFSFLFAPKSAAESMELYKIIKTLRYYALPEISKSKLFYIFPGVFRVKFLWSKAIENIWLPKIGTSVMTRINVDYSPTGSTWASLPIGDPAMIRLSFSLKEIELVDRNKVSNEDKSKSGF